MTDGHGAKSSATSTACRISLRRIGVHTILRRASHQELESLRAEPQEQPPQFPISQIQLTSGFRFGVTDWLLCCCWLFCESEKRLCTYGRLDGAAGWQAIR